MVKISDLSVKPLVPLWSHGLPCFAVYMCCSSPKWSPPQRNWGGEHMYMYIYSSVTSVFLSVHPWIHGSVHRSTVSVYPSFNLSFSMCLFKKNGLKNNNPPDIYVEYDIDRRSSKTAMTMCLLWFLDLLGGPSGHRSVSGSRSLGGFSPPREPTPPGDWRCIPVRISMVDKPQRDRERELYIYTYVYI